MNKEQFVEFAKRVVKSDKHIKDFCEEENSVWEILINNFWEMIDKGEFSFGENYDMENNFITVIKAWENFYKHWKEIQE